jgi:hypothetical protein
MLKPTGGKSLVAYSCDLLSALHWLCRLGTVFFDGDMVIDMRHRIPSLEGEKN